ncbi:MAG: tRNA(His) guanylyltransferase Thg1 family protein [Micrococcaceae bacterium]
MNYKNSERIGNKQKFTEKEKEFRRTIPKNSIMGMRLDGRSFHTFTKQFERPYDRTLMKAMDAAAITIVSKVLDNSMFAYVQSDEINVFFSDLITVKRQFEFSGREEKLLSISASGATGGFMKNCPKTQGIPMFDARLFHLKNCDELQEYMDYRRLDARKNAATMAASVLYSHKKLMHLKNDERLDLLKGTEYEKLPEDFFNGRLIVKENYEADITYFHKKERKEKTQHVICSRWKVEPALRDRTEEIVESFRERIAKTSRSLILAKG